MAGQNICSPNSSDADRMACNNAIQPCPLSTVIVEVMTSKCQPVGKAEVRVACSTWVYASGLTDNAEGKFDTDKVLNEGTYLVQAIRNCHKPKIAETFITLGQNDSQKVQLTLDPSYEIKIKARKSNYIVMLKEGKEVAAHPILDFEISDGPPNHLIDIQLSCDSAKGLSEGPGLPGSWDKAAQPEDRLGKTIFSSWSNGEKSLKLDRSGKAKYKMPMEWWHDFARTPQGQFDKKIFSYRVLAMDDGVSKPCAKSAPDTDDSAPKVELQKTTLDLTFDDGPDPILTPKILDILGDKRNNIKATFFVQGQNAKNYPKLIQQIIAEGHALGNHTYSHPDLSTCKLDRTIDEFKKTQAAIDKALGYHIEITMVRPPYGAYNSDTKKAIGPHQHIVLWDVDSNDWRYPNNDKMIFENVFSVKESVYVHGGTVLFHDTKPQTARVLTDIISRLKDEGFIFQRTDHLHGYTQPP
jgi:peptidoglycan/xylan/chitin deacetylase (PgdA/CDA1 family)